MIEVSDIIIREATYEDAEGMANLLVRSIREICGPDYGAAEDLLVPWCSNKTPSRMELMIESPAVHTIVALCDGIIAGTAAITLKGEILLCYLLPEYLHKGLGGRMLKELLHIALTHNIRSVFLESTRTAVNFYKRNGFTVIGEVLAMGRIPAFKMEKALISSD